MNGIDIAKTIYESFEIGDVIKSGGGMSEFKITEILDDRVRIQPMKSPNASRLRYEKLAVVIESFAAIDPLRIEKSVGSLLVKHGLKDAQNESYLYGFAREYLHRNPIDSRNTYLQQLDEDVKKSHRLTQSARQQRLLHAAKFPEQVTVTTKIFKRNADVIAEVLFQAKGVCGVCKKPAPFHRRLDGTPYLEVHHRKPLAVGGEDTVNNAIALCPNCHRKAHHA